MDMMRSARLSRKTGVSGNGPRTAVTNAVLPPVVRRLVGEELGAEESRIDDGRADAERRYLRLQGFHPALEAELRRGVGTHELEAGGQARGRGDRNDVAGAHAAASARDQPDLLAH